MAKAELMEQMKKKVNREVEVGEHTVTLTAFEVESSEATKDRDEHAWVKCVFQDAENFEWTHNIFEGVQLDIAVSHLRRQLKFKCEFENMFAFFQHIVDNKLSFKAYVETVAVDNGEVSRSYRNVSFLPPLQKTTTTEDLAMQKAINDIRF